MKAKNLYSQTIPVNTLTDGQVEQMFAVYSKYYGEVKLEVFESDLRNKVDICIK